MRRVLAVVFLGMVALGISGGKALAEWQVIAVWMTGQNTSSPEIIGIGPDKGAALAHARNQCNLMYINSPYDRYCLNSPARESYNEVAGGGYLKSCKKCGVYRDAKTGHDMLKCSQCIPKIEDRYLDLSLCPPETRNKIENCHGDLRCSVCEP